MGHASRDRRYPDVPPLPSALTSGNPLAWLTVFGPGAIIASLTIGTGELIFSSRGGAIFGYRILFLFIMISALKWVLVFTTARHMVLTGVHPFQRWMDLPWGPRGWFPMVLFLMAAVCMPIWVSFHSGVLGNLVSGIVGTQGGLHGTADYLWGSAILAGILLLSATSGYTVLERVQLAVVAVLLLCVTISLVLCKPDWLEMFIGAVIPQRLHYPDWLLSDPRPEYQAIAASPVWIETTRYVGVIGGASYDYLAYTSFLRDKRWGWAGLASDADVDLAAAAIDPAHPIRRWVRAPLIDCTLSFLVVVIFSSVFVASGALVLGPAHQIPGDGNFLEYQARFITRIHPWLYPLYAVGAILTMLGTLYGTLEVAPTVLREMVRSVNPELARRQAHRLRLGAMVWCAAGAFAVLGWSCVSCWQGGAARPAGLTAVLTPANLFTGVLSCGLICLINPWMDRRYLPESLRMPRSLRLLNWIAGGIFVALGLKGYWDHSRWLAMAILAGTVALGSASAWCVARWRMPE